MTYRTAGGTVHRPLLAALLLASGVATAQPAPPPEPAAPPAPAPTEVAPAALPVPSPPPVAAVPAPEQHPKADASEPHWKAVPGKGATLEAGDAFSLNIKSRFTLRYQLHGPPEKNGDRTWDQVAQVGTLRVWLGGHVRDPKIQYLIQLALAGRDYRDNATSPIFDAFFDYKAHRDISIKAGQFFVPFDRLRTVRESALQLVDRPRPVNELTLDRDVGVIAYSDSFLGDASPLAWRFGAFGGGGTNLTASREAGVLLVARVELRPLGKIDDDSEGDLQRRPKPAVAIGVGAATNRNTNRLRSTTGSNFTGGTTDYNHLAIDATFKWRGLAVQAEYLKKTSSRESIPSAADPTVLEYTRAGSGVVFQASYVFPRPVELVARYSRLWAPGGTDPKWITEVRNLGQEYATGVNYYVSGHQLKFQADWIIRTERNTSFDVVDHAIQAQLDATF